MRSAIEKSLATGLDPKIVEAILDSFENMISKNQTADYQYSLMQAGRFVEHVLRGIEFVRTGVVVTEIKSVAAEIRNIENDTGLNDSLRFLIPRALYGMIYDIRSKRNAVHVKEIDPSRIDTSLAISAASWVVAELLRLYHQGPEKDIVQLMGVLSRGRVPLVEVIADEALVTSKVPVNVELLLLLVHATPVGMSRTDLGRLAKCSASSVTRGLQSLTDDRYIHRVRDGQYFPTSTGEAYLADWIESKS